MPAVARAGTWIPILMLTARDAVEDRVRGLDAGADDYLTKPFSLAELLARLRALVRRAPIERPAVVEVGDLRLDPATRQVWRGEHEINLSKREFGLLEAFMRRRGHVLSQPQMLEAVWDLGYEQRSNVVEVYVRYLREKIDRPFGVRSLETVRGLATGCARTAVRDTVAAPRSDDGRIRARDDARADGRRALRVCAGEGGSRRGHQRRARDQGPGDRGGGYPARRALARACKRGTRNRGQVRPADLSQWPGDRGQRHGARAGAESFRADACRPRVGAGGARCHRSRGNRARPGVPALRSGASNDRGGRPVAPRP
jgi:hypothetical protein